MSTPKFSIVIPMYNVAPYVEATVQSVLKQQYTNFEIIIVNDGSTDNSLELVRQFHDSRIKIIDKQNSGVSNTRNIGCKIASGEYIACLDADDYWYPDHLSEAISFFQKYPEVPWYAAEQFQQPFSTLPPPRTTTRSFQIRNFFEDGKSFVDSSSLIFKRELFAEASGYPEDMCHYEDHVFQCMIALNHPLLGTNKHVTSIYFRRPGSASSIRIADMSPFYERILQIQMKASHKHTIQIPLYPRHILLAFLKASLFYRSQVELCAALHLYGIFLSSQTRLRWKKFIQRSYPSNVALFDECRSFVPSSLKNRIRRTIPIFRHYGFSAMIYWLTLIIQYSIRGFLDGQETRQLQYQLSRREKNSLHNKKRNMQLLNLITSSSPKMRESDSAGL